VVPAVITAWCLHSLSLPGYIVQVDSVFGPHTPSPAWGFTAPLQLVSYMVGGAAAGRLWIAAALYLCGFGPMVLFRRRHWLVQVFAGALSSLNPLVYGRLVEGQWGVAAALGTVFLWLAAWEALQRRPGWSRAVCCAGLGAAAAVFDQHSLGLLVVLAGVSLVWHRSWRHLPQLAWSGASFLLVGVLLLYGLIPFFLGHGNDSYHTIAQFSKADLIAFRAAASRTYGLWVNLAGLFGFWPERLGRIPLLNEGAPWWPLTAAILVVAALVGAWLRRDRTWLLATGILGLAVAGSTATAPGLAAMLWLMQRVPLLAAYREPEKWSALWLIALVVLGAEGLTALVVKMSAGRPLASALSAVAVVCLALAILLPDGVGAIRELPATVVPVRYPASWLDAAKYLQTRVPAHDQVVVLPWELYEPLEFTGDRLADNPAPVVFPGNLITPHDAQLAGAANQVGPDDLATVAMHPVEGSCALGSTLHRLGIHWAIVEPAPGGRADARELLSCGFEVGFGRLSGLVVLRG
jgi:hypothetical protein